jgi:RNA polymerase sigma-70 factor, ECF subfamily
MDEADCIARVVAGDKEAFAQIVRSYHRRLYFYVVGKVADGDEAEDIVQKTLVSAYHSLMAFDSRRSLIDWLRGIALNHCRNAWRQQARRARLQDRLLEARRAELLLGVLDQPDARDESRLAALRQCLESLNDPEQKAIHLRFVEEQPLKSIGDAIGKTSEGVRQFLFRIRLRLAECMKRRLEAAR